MITIDARWLSTSGIGTYLRNIIPGLIERFPGHKFCLLGNPSEIESIIGVEGANLKIVNFQSPMYSIREQFEYIKVIPKETTLYFSTHYNIPLFYRKKMMVVVYDLFHIAMPDLVQGFHKRAYAYFFFTAVKLKACSILTISEFTAREFLRLVGRPKKTLKSIPLGVDKAWFSLPNSPSPHHSKYILFVGNIKPHKNLVRLMQAFGLLIDRIPHDLVLVGKIDGFITGDNLAFSLANKMAGRVYFVGKVEKEMLEAFFKNASLLVFPSLYEGFGFPPLEAMACGCPALVSNVGPMPEVCANAALYFNPYDTSDMAEKIFLMTTDEDLRSSFITKGYDHVKNFTWEKCLDETSKIISDALI